MIEVTYCMPSAYGSGYATGSRRFADEAAFTYWLQDALTKGPMLITSIKRS